MQVGVFAKTFREPTALRYLQAAAQSGFDVVQFNMQCAGLASLPDRIETPVVAEISSAARETGVAIAALSGTYNMAHPDPAVRADCRRRLAVLIGVARALGAPLVTLCTGTRDPHDQWRYHPDNASAEAWKDMRHEMEFAVAAAERHNVLLGIEPEPGNIVRSARDAVRLFSEIGSDRLRVVFDPANLFEVASLTEQRAIVAAAIDMLADRIAIAHAKDRTQAGVVISAGRGALDYRHFLARLRAAGFDGPLIAHELSPDEAPRVARFLRAALAEAAT